MRDRLVGYQTRIATRLREGAADVVDCGLVDSPDRALWAADRLGAACVDMVFLYVALREALSENEVRAMADRFAATFDIDPACSDGELGRAARTAGALQALVDRHRPGSLAYYYEGSRNAAHLDVVTSVIPGNTLLTANGVPVAGEYEGKNVQAMKILDLAGAGGFFSEFYAMDFNEEVVLLGHDGPGHAAIAKERVRLVPLG